MILTTAVVAIIITAPLGAILINTLGIRWLTCDAEEGEGEGLTPADKVAKINKGYVADIELS
jgi:hypothetical protein